MDGKKPPLSITCKCCKHSNVFAQPYPYHAGFGDQGFVYNEAGNLTLTWSVYDPYFKKNFEMLLWPPNNKEVVEKMENALPLSPRGDKWLFSARCEKCHDTIAGPMSATVYYLVFPGSVNLEDGGLWMEFYVEGEKKFPLRAK